MEVPDTVTQAIAFLKNEGYEADFNFVDGALCNHDSSVRCDPNEVVVERLFRFEGDSDPGDEMIVFGVVDPTTGVRGVVASAYGPAADPEVLDHLIGIASRRRGP